MAPPFATTASGGKGGGGGATLAGPTIDDEGYELVPGKGKGRKAASTAAQGSNTAAATVTVVDDGTGGAADAQAGAASGGGGGGAEDVVHEGSVEHDDQAQHAPTEEELHERWTRERKIVEFLVQQGLAEDDPVRITAERQAAATKAAWQATKPGFAVTTRLVWAEQALRRSKRVQTKMEQTISDLDDEYERTRAEHIDKLHEMRGRTREREDKLAEVSREAALEFQAPADDGATQGPLRDAMGTIEGPLRDAVQEALDQALAGSALHTRLSGALGALSDLRGLVAEVARPRWADVYDLANDDEEQWERRDGQWTNEDCWTQGGGHWDGWGRWVPWPQSSQHGPWAAAPMDTSDIQVPQWMRNSADADDGSTWDDRSWKRGRGHGDEPSGVQGRHAAFEEVPADHEAAARLQAMVQDGTAAAAALAAQSTPVVEDAALEKRKQEVWDQAQNDSVPVSYETIASMDAATLEEWATANLL